VTTALTKNRAARRVERRAADGGVVTEYLGFRVASNSYALPVSIVREIVRAAHVTPVPRAPAGVLGIASFRGRVVTIIDLGTRLGLTCSIALPAAGPLRGHRLRILMVDIGLETLGYLVDEVLMVYRLSNKDIERATHTLGSDAGAHVAGIARPAESEEVLLLLDAKALVP